MKFYNFFLNDLVFRKREIKEHLRKKEYLIEDNIDLLASHPKWKWNGAVDVLWAILKIEIKQNQPSSFNYKGH